VVTRDEVGKVPWRVNVVAVEPPGSVLPLFGASEGRKTSWEVCLGERRAVVSES
jgi:hypothetical protein